MESAAWLGAAVLDRWLQLAGQGDTAVTRLDLAGYPVPAARLLAATSLSGTTVRGDLYLNTGSTNIPGRGPGRGKLQVLKCFDFIYAGNDLFPIFNSK